MECSPNPDCKYYKSKHGCRENTHHIFYPKRDYQTPVEKDFRELPENKVALCMVEHEEIHRTERPPQKPDRDEMLVAINGIRRASDV